MSRKMFVGVALGLVVGAGLMMAGLLTALATLAWCAATAWLVVRACSAEPPPGSLPPIGAGGGGASVAPLSDVERLREVTVVARRLPGHLLADADAVPRVPGMPTSLGAGGTARVVDELREAVGG